jgi:Type I phosphodiesterase / nucleotide pyrophosphatase
VKVRGNGSAKASRMSALRLVLPFIFVASLWILGAPIRANHGESAARQRNVVIFVADGLRHGSVNATSAPTLYRIQTEGVNFLNSHSLFPTFTTANASAIATGHYLGDTGDFSNSIYLGYPIFSSGNFGKKAGSVTPFIENDLVLGDMDAHFQGNYLNEETLLAAARRQGYLTASIGKAGPVGIQDAPELNPDQGRFALPATIILDDATGTPDGVPLTDEVAAALIHAGLPTTTPVRVQPAGNNVTPGTKHSNERQQAYFADATTRAILPMFKNSRQPFVLLYWSRDPDGSQHNQGDSLNTLVPGINGPTSLRGLRDADDNLRQILNFIEGDGKLASDTDIFVTSDHGFATVSRHEIDSQGRTTKSYAAKWTYRDRSGRQEVNTGFLPSGFLAIDLAHFLDLPLFNPDSQIEGPGGEKVYERVDPTIPRQESTVQQHPATGTGLIGSGNGLIGGTGRVLVHTDADVIVAGNGGSDLLYVPGENPDLVKKIVGFLAQQDYVGGLFVNDRFGKLPGALPLSAVRLLGASKIPAPAVVVSFKEFAADPHRPIMTAVQVADTSLQEGQGMHGGLGRDSTFNFMAAIGPDFKKRFVDESPVSNADIEPTLARILHLHVEPRGTLTGRVLTEALVGGPSSIPFRHRVAVSERSATGDGTILMYQQAGQQVYFDRACFTELAKAPHQCP